MWLMRGWRRRRFLKRRRLPEKAWQDAWNALPLLHRLDAGDRERLRDLSQLFIHEKSLEPAGGLVLDQTMEITVAALACLPILHLGLDWYDGWRSVILYPGEFVPHREWRDAAGVVHTDGEARTGEAWLHGPVVLSWPDVQSAGTGYNVVIHEMAHKLDALNGATNGLPPLHPEMRLAEWADAFTRVFDELQRCVERGLPTPIDPYAAESPAEFFAVASECFFTDPGVLFEAYPAVYRQLAAFYRQDPLLTPC